MSFNFGSEVAIKRNHRAHTLTFDIIEVGLQLNYCKYARISLIQTS